jgi:hypothetical protein
VAAALFYFEIFYRFCAKGVAYITITFPSLITCYDTSGPFIKTAAKLYEVKNGESLNA